MSVIEAFPKRHLQLSGYDEPTTTVVWVVCALWFVFVPILLHSSVLSLNNDYRLRASGTVANESEVKNYNCYPKAADVEFDVRYVTHDGSSHTQHVDLFPTLFEPDRKSAFIVRYDPASPEQISTSWGAELLPNRTVMLIAEIGIYLATIAFAVWLMVNRIKLRRNLAAIGAQPTPLEVKLVGGAATPRSGSAEISYAWTDASGRPLTGSTRFKDTQEPFWLDAAKTKMLALAGPGGQAVLLDAALTGVTLSDQERTRIVEAQACALKPSLASEREHRDVKMSASTNSLRNAAMELSSALNQIVSGLLSDDSVNASYARRLASTLGPLVEDYNHAVFVTCSRDEAGRALSELTGCMGTVIGASTKGEMNFGIGRALGRYSDLHMIFRESKYREELL